jgi:poly(A) polymerase
MAELEVRIERIVREDATPAPLSKGIGVAIMAQYGLRPSRLVGELKRLLEVAIEAGELPARGDDATYLAWFDAQPELVARIAAESAARAPLGARVATTGDIEAAA